MNFLPPSASNFSPTIDLIFKSLLMISSVLVILVWGLIVFFAVKYRAGSSAHRQAAPTKATKAELGLCGLIFLFGLGIFIWSAQTYYQMYTPPASSLEIGVVAKQWMWMFHDSHGKDQINSFKIPLGKPLRLLMTSEDVIHSFFIPAFRIKQDILPGRYTSVWFTPRRLGKFEVLCSQYCGLSHSQMRATVEVLTPEAYEKYLKETDTPSLTAAPTGAQIYAKSGCVSCHDGSSSVGPSLSGLYGQAVVLANGAKVRADENYLRRAILEPNSEIVRGYQGVMPTFQGQLSEEQLIKLISYIKSKR